MNAILESRDHLPAQRYYRLEKPRKAPISLVDAKRFLRVDDGDNDAQIQRFIDAAISYLEGSGQDRDGVLGKALMTQTWVLEAERPHHGRIAIEYGIVRPDGILSVDVIYQGTTLPWAPENYRLGFRNSEAFIVPVSGQSFPPHDLREDAFTITYLCGYGDQVCDVPANLIEAMLMHIGHLYENRAAVVLDSKGQAVTVPFGYMDHIAPQRRIPVV